MVSSKGGATHQSTRGLWPAGAQGAEGTILGRRTGGGDGGNQGEETHGEVSGTRGKRGRMKNTVPEAAISGKRIGDQQPPPPHLPPGFQLAAGLHNEEEVRSRNCAA